MLLMRSIKKSCRGCSTNSTGFFILLIWRKEIIFKVQIAAHTVPLTEEYLRTIYLGGMQIDMIYEEEWYKYSIGRYKTLEEATETLEICNVKKAFIIAYQEGKKLTIQEALERMALQEKLNKE